MPPFRNRDRSNRSGRAQVEHNVLEGLPINQYREVEVTVGAGSADNKPADKNAWPELPMPRDSHLLPEHSQQLLRAARAGRVYKPPTPIEDDNEMKDEEEESKEVQTGFTIKKYVKVPRHLEVAEPEFLAKRRKGLPSQYSANGVVQAPLRETKVKKVDAEGNATVYKVLVPEGQAVEGEVEATDAAMETAPATAVPGTVVEGVGIVNAEGVVVAGDVMVQTPPRRRVPPPPKKKRGGPGRSKKKVVFTEEATDQETSTPNANGDQLAVPGVKQENGSVEPSDGDTPMAQAGGDDEEGSGEEGSEDEGTEMDQTPAPQTPATPGQASAAPTSAPSLDAAELANLESAASAEPVPAPAEEIPQPPMDLVETDDAQQPAPEADQSVEMPDRSSSPDLPLSTVSHSRQNSINLTLASTTEPEPMVIDPVEPSVEPVKSVTPETVPEPAAEPSSEHIAEPVAEPVFEPVVAADPFPESLPEPVPEQMVESIAQEAVEPPVLPSVVSPVEPPVAPLVAPPIETVVQSVPAPAPISPPAPVEIPAHVPVTGVVETEASVPGQIQDDTQAAVSADVLEQEAPFAPQPEQVSAPPSEPDLMGSLERHLEKDSAEMGGS